MSFHRPIAAIVLTAIPFLVPAPAAASVDLEIESASPQGLVKKDRADRIQIVFSKAMAPLAAPDTSGAPPDWLVVEPSILAKWRWAGTSVLVGEPLAKLPRSTAYRVRVARGARAMDGSALAAEFAFSFSTELATAVITLEPPQGVDLDDFVRYWGKPSSVSARAAILVVWDQPVDDGSFAQQLAVRVHPNPLPGAGDLLSNSDRNRLSREDPEAFESWKRFVEESSGAPEGEARYTIEPDPGRPHQVFRIRPQGEWPLSSSLEVTVRPGVRALEGTAPTVDPTTHWLVAPRPFGPSGIEGRSTVETRGGLDPESVAISFTSEVRWRDLVPHFRWRKDGATAWRTIEPRPQAWWWEASTTKLSFELLGIEGGSAYEVCLGKAAADVEGRVLGFPWCGRFRTARRPPRFHLVESDGVVEIDGPHVLPLASTNVRTYRLAQRLVAEDELVRVLAARERAVPEGSGPAAVTKQLVEAPDRRIVSPVELDPVLGGKPGIVWSAVEAVSVVAGSEYEGAEKQALRRTRTALTQVTALGLTVKTSRHEGVLAWVTRLADGRPVAGAVVRVRDEDNRVVWEGTTDGDGLARSAADLGPKPPVLVTARMGDDLAYARTNWDEGHRGWEFNLPVDWHDRAPVTGAVWPDRGIVRPGESVRVKAVLREQGERGLRVPARRQAVVVVRDSRGRDVETTDVTLDRWGAAEIEIAVPPGAPLGAWDVQVLPERPAPNGATAGPGYEASGSFRVAEFRRPKFRVSVTPERTELVAGDALAATIEGALLAGGYPSGAAASWSVRATRAATRPSGARFDEYEFLPAGFWDEDAGNVSERERTVAKETGTLDGRGRLDVRVPRVETLGTWPTSLEIEAEVRDVDRQTSAARTVVEVEPAEFRIGVRRPGFFVEARNGVDTKIVALLRDGAPAPAATVRLKLVRRHWESVRRRDASGRYDFESRPVDETIEESAVETAADPVDVHLDLPGAGYYALVAAAEDSRGNSTETATAFYVLGEGDSPWRLDRENRVELVVERERYAPGRRPASSSSRRGIARQPSSASSAPACSSPASSSLPARCRSSRFRSRRSTRPTSSSRSCSSEAASRRRRIRRWPTPGSPRTGSGTRRSPFRPRAARSKCVSRRAARNTAPERRRPRRCTWTAPTGVRAAPRSRSGRWTRVCSR